MKPFVELTLRTSGGENSKQKVYINIDFIEMLTECSGSTNIYTLGDGKHPCYVVEDIQTVREKIDDVDYKRGLYS